MAVSKDSEEDGMRFFELLERLVIIALLLMMVFIVVAITFELGVMLVRDLWTPPYFLLEEKEISELFGFVLMIMVGLELQETIKAYRKEHRIHVEVVMMVAIVAVARKIIILDYKEIAALQLVGISSILLALGIGYYLIRRVTHAALPEDSSSG
jgi:uncharacterized membrane protein (DUF373 family)